MASIRDMFNGLRQVSSLYSEVQNMGKEEDELLFLLKKALDSLKENINKSAHTVQSQARDTLVALNEILGLSPREREKVLGNPGNLGAIDHALGELRDCLDHFVNPTLQHPQPAISQILNHIPAAEQALNNQIAASQGIISRAVAAFVKAVVREGSAAAQKVSGSGKQKQVFAFHHPLLELRQFIGFFQGSNSYYLPEDREEHLRHTIELLANYSNRFGSIEINATGKRYNHINDYVKERLGPGLKFHENLPSIIKHVNDFLKEKIKKLLPSDKRTFHLIFYECAKNQLHSQAPKLDRDETKILWAEAKVAEEPDRDVLWEAFAQFDEVSLMQDYLNKIEGHQHYEDVEDLADNVDRILMYFQHIPQSQIKEEALKRISEVLLGCYIFSKNWIEGNVSGRPLESSGEKLAEVYEAINKQDYLQAIRLLKQEIEQGPLSNSFAAKGKTVSPSKDLQTINDEFEASFEGVRGRSATDFEWELEEARRGLSEIMSYYTTFNIVMGQILRIPKEKSDNIYNRIIAEVQKKPESKTRTFFLQLYIEINQLSEVSIIFRLIAKILMFPIYAPIRLFTNHTAASGLHFVKHYIELPSKEPLGKIHVAPFEKFTNCFQANMGAMKAWAKDETCERFGAATRNEALRNILKNPKFNDQFEREELVKKAGILATDLFLNISHFKELPAMMRRNLAYNIDRPFFPIAEDHWVNWIAGSIKSIIGLAPQAAIEILHYGCAIIDYFINTLIKWGVKRILVAYELPNRLFKSLSNSVYGSQYIPVFDGIILKQFELIEKLIDEESSESTRSEKESTITRETIKETIDNLFEMIEMRHNLTKTKMLNPRKDDIPFVDEHTREVTRALVDENLSETIVNLLITLIQSLFNENRVNDFLLNLIRACSASLSTRESFLSEEEKAELRRSKGALTERIIQDEIVSKCSKQEHAINEVRRRIIEKSVHQVVQTQKESAMSQKASLEYTNWLERRFYGSKRSNFISGMQQKLDKIKMGEGVTSKLTDEMIRDFRAFMREFEQKQKALDLEPIAQTRRLQRFANKVLIPNLQNISRELRRLSNNPNACEGLQRALQRFNENLLTTKVHYNSIRSVELERKYQEAEGLVGKFRLAIKGGIESVSPALSKKVEEVIVTKLDNFAKGVLQLPKDPSFTESALCTVILCPFLKTYDVKPDLRFREESPIIPQYGY